MRELKTYQCEWCKKIFRTPNRHYCKFNPELRNCFTCKHSRGWVEEKPYPPWNSPDVYPDCEQGMGEDWDINRIKEVGYNVQCKGWEGKP